MQKVPAGEVLSPTPFLKPLAILDGFGKTLHIDHVRPVKPGPDGHHYIFTVIDSFSKYVWLYPVYDTTAEVAVTCLLSVVKKAGPF